MENYQVPAILEIYCKPEIYIVPYFAQNRLSNTMFYHTEFIGNNNNKDLLSFVLFFE